MKILFVCDYFPPFTPGGAEWSSYFLAKALSSKQGIKLIILTPNYQKHSCKNDLDAGLEIIRYPFWPKLIPGATILSNIYNHQPFYYLYSAFWVIKT